MPSRDARCTTRCCRTSSAAPSAGGHRRAAVDPGEVAEAVPAGLGRAAASPRRRRRPASGATLWSPASGDRLGLARDVLADPPAAELADLLLERHLAPAALDPVGDRTADVSPGPCRDLRRALESTGCLHFASDSGSCLPKLSKLPELGVDRQALRCDRTLSASRARRTSRPLTRDAKSYVDENSTLTCESPAEISAKISCRLREHSMMAGDVAHDDRSPRRPRHEYGDQRGPQTTISSQLPQPRRRRGRRRRPRRLRQLRPQHQHRRWLR